MRSTILHLSFCRDLFIVLLFLAIRMVKSCKVWRVALRVSLSTLILICIKMHSIQHSDFCHLVKENDLINRNWVTELK